MASLSKVERKELKAPDPFVSWSARAYGAVAARKRQIGMALVGAAAAVATLWGYNTIKEKQHDATARAFARIELLASAPLLPEQGEPAFSDDLPHYKTASERREAVGKEVDRFLAEHGGSVLRPAALLVKAKLQLAAGKTKDAGATYDEALAGAIDPKFRFAALEGKAYALEAAGDVPGALAGFAMLADATTDEFYRDRALFGKARLLEQQGKSEDATRTYRDILDKSPTSSLRDRINDRLAVLEEAKALPTSP